MPSDPNDVEAYAAELERSLLPRDEDDTHMAAKLLDVLSGDAEAAENAWMESGEDLGTEAFKGYSGDDLVAFLGLPPNGRPPVMRRYILRDELSRYGSSDLPIWTGQPPPDFVERQDEEKWGVRRDREREQGRVHAPGLLTTESMLAFHQLQAVAFMVHRMGNPRVLTQKNILDPAQLNPTAPVALRERWSEVPGVMLFDTVGLGKTVECLAMIGTLIHLIDLQEKRRADPSLQPPPCMQGGRLRCFVVTPTLADCCAENYKFGCVDEIPNASHLIVAPTNLVKQWAQEIERFMNPSHVRLFQIRSGDKYWATDLKAFSAAPMPACKKIVLASARVGVPFMLVVKARIIHRRCSAWRVVR